MNKEDLQSWREAIKYHVGTLDKLVEERQALKEVFEEHLSNFFSWDGIEYNRDFSRISLYYKKDTGAVIKSDNMSELGMDWIVSPEYDDRAFKIIRIDLYPFGLPEEGEVIEE